MREARKNFASWSIPYAMEISMFVWVARSVKNRLTGSAFLSQTPALSRTKYLILQGCGEIVDKMWITKNEVVWAPSGLRKGRLGRHPKRRVGFAPHGRAQKHQT